MSEKGNGEAWAKLLFLHNLSLPIVNSSRSRHWSSRSRCVKVGDPHFTLRDHWIWSSRSRRSIFTEKNCSFKHFVKQVERTSFSRNFHTTNQPCCPNFVKPRNVF